MTIDEPPALGRWTGLRLRRSPARPGRAASPCRTPRPSGRWTERDYTRPPVTYCLAMRLDEGLVFLSDTRTNAGVDNVGTYRKLHVFRPAPDRLFVLQSAGNLATTQEVLDRIAVDLEAVGRARQPRDRPAPLRGGALRRPARARGRRRPTAPRSGRTPPRRSSSAASSARRRRTSCWCTPRATTSGPRTTGRSSRSARASTGSSCSTSRSSPTPISMTSLKIALGSMMSTARANLSVGPPVRRGRLSQRRLRPRRAPVHGRIAGPRRAPRGLGAEHPERRRPAPGRRAVRAAGGGRPGRRLTYARCTVTAVP